jgi:D-glycero-D-manno-heptose 1,7-bisphosphate phosphatase
MCPHTPADGCHCRKPMPGLIEMACNDLGLDPQRSFVVGDKRSDIDLARAVGAEAFLVTTGYGADAAQYARELGIPVCESLLEVSASILARLYQSSRTSEL